MTLYLRRSFSVTARSRGTMCVEKGHAGADSRGDCHCCGEKVDRCSRCKHAIADYRRPLEGMTAGYYMARAFPKYSNAGEVQICDECMWKDPRYIADHGVMRSELALTDEQLGAALERSPFNMLVDNIESLELVDAIDTVLEPAVEFVEIDRGPLDGETRPLADFTPFHARVYSIVANGQTLYYRQIGDTVAPRRFTFDGFGH